MAVALTVDQRNALRGHAIAIRTLIDIYLDSGRYSFWDGDPNGEFDGTTYLAAAALGWISPISMSQDLGAEGVEMTLDGSRLVEGSPDALDAAALLGSIELESYQLRRTEIRFAFFSAETGELLLLLRRHTGSIDQIRQLEEIDDSGGARQLMVVAVESLARRYGRRAGRTRSHEDQTEIFAGDTFFKFTASSIAKQGALTWGRPGTPSVLQRGGPFRSYRPGRDNY
jgi:hypothetical protein